MIDWAEVNFIIGTNPESFIEIKFDERTIDTELGLKAYMNTLISTHEVISQFELKKVLTGRFKSVSKIFTEFSFTKLRILILISRGSVFDRSERLTSPSDSVPI